MRDGIYHVRFASTMGAAGEGLVVVKDRSINGGDAGYLYQGVLASDAAGELRGQLQVKRWNAGHASVFGLLGNVRDATEDEQRDALDGQPARLGHDRVAKLVEQHRYEQEQRRGRSDNPVRLA